ncbi:2Fe-2S iron-sulfur cluster-binding protein [Pseudomonas sp.]|jgi:2Fe-2S ferredoxin|uniref:2Fe-2S iron-sulfur cluster-binding protein n=1 Tax=Pseudomonas sp. TaxID=306 RepID=UPI00261252F0|nr:2Fe-2S iron-sulfur cluster-binding protein [Pseudomonas sp.]
MPNVTFISPDGSSDTLDIANDTSLMRAAIANGLHAIVGDCGGSAACATCHVYVQEKFLNRLPPISDNEDQLLESTSSPRRGNSRLSCQILMSPELDGIRVEIAETQW